VTAPMEIRVPTPKPIHVPQVPVRVETREKAISPFVIPATAGVDESIESTATHSVVTDDNVETIKATYEDKIAKLHENYQYIILNFLFFVTNFWIFRAEIRRLTKLLGEIPSRLSSQMAELSELDENLRESVDEPSDADTR